MSITRFTDGDATVTLTGLDEEFVRGAVAAAIGAVLTTMEDGGEEVAGEARREWYGPNGVTKETGLSGDIQCITTVDLSKSEVRVSIGSVDSRVVQAYKKKNDGTADDATRQVGGKSKPVVAFVHRPGPYALVKVEVTAEEYWKTAKDMRANFKPLPANPKTGFAGDKGAGPFVWKISPKASDGKYLLAELVRKPAARMVARITPQLGRDIAARIRGR